MKKTLALILSALMLVSVMAVSAFAAEAPGAVHAFSVLNGDIQGSRLDNPGHATDVALRFATSEVLTAIYPYMAGSATQADKTTVSSFDVNVYKWSYNYADTVAGTPVVTVDDLTFGGSGWTNWTKSLLPAGTELPAGEYLVVISDAKVDWAACSYVQAPIVGAEKAVKTYVNGEQKLLADGSYTKVGDEQVNFASGSYATLAWKLEFAGGVDGLVKADLAEDTATPTTATTTAAPDTAGSSDNAGDSTETSDNALVVSMAAAAVMGLAVLCVVKKKQH